MPRTLPVLLCPACESTATDAFVERADGARLRRCKACETLFLEERPADLEGLYRDAYFGADGQEGVGYETGYTAIQEQLWQLGWVLFVTDVLGRPAAPLLDVGCATGQFLALARGAGLAPLAGVDLAPGAVLQAGERGLDVVRGDVDVYAEGQVPGRLAAITAWDLLEHLPHPRATAGRLAALLADAGVFCFSTPNADAARGLPDPAGWSGFGHSFEHLFYLGEAGLEALLKHEFAARLYRSFHLYGGDFLLGVATKRPPTLRQAALIGAALGDPTTLREAMAAGEIGPVGLAGLAMVEVMLGDGTLAAELAARVEPAGGEPALAAFVRGAVAHRTGRYAEARADYERAAAAPRLAEVANASLVDMLGRELAAVRQELATTREQAQAAQAKAAKRLADATRAQVEATTEAGRLAARVAELEVALTAIYDGLAWQTVRAAQDAKDKVLPHGTRRRRAYDLALKGVKVLKSEGPTSFATRVRRKVRLRAQGTPAARLAHEALRDKILARHAGKRVVVFLPTVDWGWMVQRPHQLARALARAGCLVFYVTAQMRTDRVDGFEEVADGLYLCADAGLLAPVAHPVVIAANLDHLAEANRLTRPFLIYDVLDDLAVTAAGGNAEAARQAHRQLLQGAGMVLATAGRLLEEAKAVRPDALLVPNACDPAHFAPDAGRKVPAELAEIVAAGRPIAGYYGALASWFDYDLLDAVAAKLPGWEFVLLGPDYDGTAARLPKRPNVRWLGLKDYAALPAYLQAFTVATIPFVINDVTRATSPVKLFEYLAGDKPVVTTPMDEAYQYEAVTVADGPEAFAQALEAARAQAASPRAVATRRRETEANTWDARAAAILAGVAAREAEPRDVAVILAGVPIDDSGGGQRPAQLALELLDRGWRVVYVHKYPKHEHRELGLSIVHPRLEHRDLAEFDAHATLAGRPPGKLLGIVELPHPDFLPAIEALKAQGGKIAYDLIDDWATSLGGEWYRGEVEDRIAASSDVLVASAKDLVTNLQGRTRRPVALVPNAVNERLFDRAKAWPRPADLPAGSPQILYIGALWGEWFDWELVRAVAEAHPQAAVTLIGDYAGQCPFEPLPNMRFLGLKAQRELPAYLAHADVALIPFVVSRLTQAVSPLKVFEYLAMGVPTVSTPLVELEGMPHVHLAATPAAFAAAVGRAAAEPVDEGVLAAFARANGWEARVDALLAAAWPGAGT